MTIAFVGSSVAQYESIGDPTAVNGNCAAGTGSDVLVLGFIFIWAASTGTSWACTYNSNSMSIRGNYVVSSGRIIIFDYAAGDNPGTHDVAFTSDASTGSVWLQVCSFTGVKQSGYADTSATATATDASVTVTISPSHDNTALVAICIIDDNEAPSPVNETDINSNYPGFGEGLGSIYTIQTTATSNAMDWSKSGTETWRALTVNYQEAATVDLTINPTPESVTVSDTATVDLTIDIGHGADNYDNWVQGLRITQ